MRRTWRAGLVAAVIFALSAAPALGGDGDTQPAIDINTFLPSDMADDAEDPGLAPEPFDDKNGDGLPDVPDGRHGRWDDTVGAKTPLEFLQEVDIFGVTFDFDDDLSQMKGPCGGLAISYDAAGNSIDAVVDAGDDDPAIDVFSGEQAFTRDNPMKIDSSGFVAYFGFTKETTKMSTEGKLAGVNYGDGAKAFHDHRWEVVILDVSADDGGDPNPTDHNRNAAVVNLGEILPIKFRAHLKARGGMIDLFSKSLEGPNPLPSLTADTVKATAAGREYCFGEGWVEFVGDDFPLFTIPGLLGLAFAAVGFSGVVFNARPVKSWRIG